jgi:hypothetical protein
LRFETNQRTRGAKNIPKTVLKTRLKMKETTYTLVFVKCLWSLSEANKAMFSVFGIFIDDYLRNLTCWEIYSLENI